MDASEPDRSDTVFVLAVDGGGIRGIIPACVLVEIERRTGRPVSSLFDLVAGTSTGGIIVLGLNKPAPGGGPEFSAAQMRDLYVEDGSKIFARSLLREITTLHGLLDARYPAGPLEGILRERFGETMLSEALSEVVIPSYDLTRPGPYFFKREYADESEEWNTPMAQVARATSAAPTYFDPAVIPAQDGGAAHALVDGGTFANNPTLSGYVDALRLMRKRKARRVVVVSIGTGRAPQTPGSGPIPIGADRAGSFGLLRWAPAILEVVLDGVPKAVEYQMNVLAGGDESSLVYHRIESELPTASHAMDDASPENCERLLDDARTLIEKNDDTLDEICAELAPE